MRRIFTDLAILVCLTASTFAASEQKTMPASTTAPIILKHDVIHNLILGYGIVTTIKIDSPKKVERVLLGSPIVTFKVEDEINRVNFRPRVQQGATNMVLTVGGVDYNFVIQVTPEVSQVVYTKTYLISEDAAEQEATDLGALGKAPIMKPADIDPVAISKAIEQARKDPIYRRAAMADMRTLPLNKIYQWNNCVIHFLEVNQLLNSDTIAIKIQWVNTSGYGLYLNPKQLEVRIANKRIRVKSCMQDAPDSIVNPGQMDTLWLIVQGERITIDNDWELAFPPDSKSVMKGLKGL